MLTASDRQRAYYEQTAAEYNASHLHEREHEVALSAFVGMARHFGTPSSVLDVGSGTGRSIGFLQTEWPQAHIMGIEPVEALRRVGHANGISQDRLIEGDALKIDFPADSFDWVVATSILHHIARPQVAVREMLRVARLGIMISDSNNVGQGSSLIRLVKRATKAIGLWPLLIWLQTGGKMHKFSEGDGIYYSFCIFDHLDDIRQRFPNVFLFNTRPVNSGNLYRDASHAALVATSDDIMRRSPSARAALS